MADDWKDNSTPQYREWQCPPAASPEERRLGWLDEQCEEGQAWLRSQRGYSDIKPALDILAGRNLGDLPPDYRSRINTNRLKRNVREVIGTLSKLRPMWGYQSDNRAFSDNAEMMNKVARALYLERFFDRSIREALQFAAASMTGYVRPVYRRELYGTGKGDITLFTYGSPCVLPTQLPANGDLQSAYTVTLLDEMPIAMAHGMFPRYQDRLRPTSSRYWYSAEIRQSAKGNLFQRIFTKRNVSNTGLQSDLLVPIRYTYVLDLTVNQTGQTIPMGEPGTTWAYTVPSLDAPIDLGGGTFRKATAVDARLYPYRRLIISSESCIMYDGPAFDWHGRVPLIPFRTDDWPWEPLGFSLIRDGYEIQTELNNLERGVLDKHKAALDPALGYDINSVSRKEATEFDPMQPRGRVGYDGSMTEAPFKSVLTAEERRVDPATVPYIQHLEEEMDHQMGVHDMMALARARAIGSSGDSIDKILEESGPVVEDISRTMEPPMRELGDQVKYLILQYMTTSRIMQYVGADGVTLETFDYDPDSLIPSHLPGEPDTSPSVYSKVQRARNFADNLRFLITPNSLHELTQMVLKVGYIQLRKAGVQISSQAIAEVWGVPNFGKLDGNTELEKWRSEQEMMIEFAARAKALGDTLSLFPGLGQLATAAPDANATPGSPQQAPMGAHAGGRPPEGQAAPQIAQRDGGTRSTIMESR